MRNTISTTTTLERQPDESTEEWQDRLKDHIQKTAPDEYRYYVRGSKPGRSWQRWIFSGIFGVVGLIFVSSGYVNSAQIRELNSADSAQGNFIVERLQREPKYGILEENQPLVPVVTIRGQSIVPLYSHNHDYVVGKSVTLKYTQDDNVTASFMDEHGRIPNISFIMMLIVGAFFAGVAVLVGIYYRGVVDPRYIDRELAHLTKR